MVLGLISDVHANVVALDAALRALRGHGARTIVCLGDMVGYGPAPNETIERLREERILCTLGAADERIAFDFARRAPPRKGVGDATLEWTREVLEEVHVAWLRELPVQRKVETPFGRLRAFHGTLDDPGERTDLQIDPIALGKLFDRHRCRILAAGATHVPYLRRTGAGVAVNPGSVGLSLNGEPGADYALLRVDEEHVDVRMGKEDYDVAAVAFDIVAWGLPSVVAEAVQMGRMPDRTATDDAAHDRDAHEDGASEDDAGEDDLT